MVATDRPVVAGVDGSPSSLAAARHAARAAAARNTSLDLVHGYLHPLGYGAVPIDPYAAAIPAPPVAGQEMLDRLAADLRTAHPGLTVTARQVAGGPAATLVDMSRHAELLVVGCRGLGGFAGLVLGSVSAQVAAHAHCPVLVLRPAQTDSQENGDGDGDAGGPVLVGVDFSPPGEAAVAAAGDEAALRGAELTLLHAWWNDPIDTLAHPAGDVVGLAGEAAAAALAEVAAGVRRAHPGLAVHERLEHSLNPAHALVEASAGAAVVAVGSRGRGGFADLLLGSVSRTLVHHARCPVLVVHPRSHEADERG